MPPPSRQNTYGAVNMHQPTFGGGTAAMHGARLLEQDRFQHHTQQQQHHVAQQLYPRTTQQQLQQMQLQATHAQQQKSLVALLTDRGPGVGAGVNGIAGVSAAGLGGTLAGARGAAEMRANAMAAATAAAAAQENGPEKVIRDVWAEDLQREMGILREVVDKYPYIAMDTEFPGIVARPVGQFASKADYHYQTLRCNVDMLKIIQLGVTLYDSNGTPCSIDGRVSTWQFNFRFSLTSDMYATESIDLLKKSGIDFARHAAHGIRVADFGDLLISSGLVMIDDVNWLSFHSGYDFGYLVKIMSASALPKEEAEFTRLLHLFFPSLYDIKFLLKSARLMKGGLQDIAEEMGIARIGPQHQAGSDSLLTGNIFFAIRQKYFGGQIEPRFNGQVWGLGDTTSNRIEIRPEAGTQGTQTPGTPSNSGGPPEQNVNGTPGR